MSDPMTNAEVEDVLSSIRRLVSDEKPAESAQPAQAMPDRLVLTPSLRIDDTEPSAETGDAEETAFEDEAAAEPAEDSDADRTLTDFLFEHRAVSSSDDAEHVDETDMDEAEEAVNWREDAAEIDEAHGADAFFEHEPENHDAVEVDADDPQQPAETPSDERTLSDKIAALETLVGGRTDEWEPDDPGADAYAGTEAPTLAWEDAEMEDVDAFDDRSDDQPADDDDDDLDTQIFASDEDVLDEEALRDLVADIVREELQGALGERITRNVRKLVRREIHRALAAQELE